MDPADYPITAVQDNRDEWTHANGFFEMPDGNILLSYRLTVPHALLAVADEVIE